MFNNKNESALKKIKTRRIEQTKVMKRVNAIIRAVWTYGGHIVVKHPRHSFFWKQGFCENMLTDAPKHRALRDFTVNFCRVGGDHFKAM